MYLLYVPIIYVPMYVPIIITICMDLTRKECAKYGVMFLDGGGGKVIVGFFTN